MEIHRGCEDGQDTLPECVQIHAGCVPVHIHTHTCTHVWVPRASLPTPPGPSGGAAMELKRNKLLPVGQNTPNPNTPSPPKQNQSKRKDGHWNKPRRGGKQWKTSFGSDNEILDSDFLCMLFGFPLEQRCVRRPWLASWQGSLQVCFLSVQFIPSLSRVRLFATPWTAARFLYLFFFF